MAKGNTNLILGVLGVAGVGAAVWYFMKKKGVDEAAYQFPGYSAGAYVPEVALPTDGQAASGGGVPGAGLAAAMLTGRKSPPVKQYFKELKS